MTTLDVLRVFVGPDGRGGNPLGVFLDASAIAPERRQGIARDLGFSETVFVDDVARGACRIFTPGRELPFAGHPSVGTAWLLREVGTPIAVLRPPAGDVEVRYGDPSTWVAARAEWVHDFARRQLNDPAEVDGFTPPPMGEPGVYIWAWLDEPAGILRARYFPTDLGIMEDEATGAAAVVMGDALRRPLTIRQGFGSEIEVRPLNDGRVEIGGRVERIERREIDLGGNVGL